MKIPSPKVQRGQLCQVFNYRARRDKWENGKVVGLSYENQFGSFDWIYRVHLLRRSATDRIISLTVNGELILGFMRAKAEGEK